MRERMPIELTRNVSEESISSYLARIEMLVETALEEASMKPEEADAVLLVGGSTRIPIVQNKLQKIFDKELTMWQRWWSCRLLGLRLCRARNKEQ